MKRYRIEAAPSVVATWEEAYHHKRHTLAVYVDGWRLEPAPVIRYLSAELADYALDPDREHRGAGWYVDAGTLSCGDELPERGRGPLDQLVGRLVAERLAELRADPAPPEKTLHRFRLEACGREVMFLAEDCTDIGVLINPFLPEGFDDTPNDERSEEELARWWGRRFIETSRIEDQLEDFESYAARCEIDGMEPHFAQADWEAQQQQLRQQLEERYPSGTAYHVRCLDGGAWDRSTWWGSTDTLEGALEIAARGPAWRNQGE